MSHLNPSAEQASALHHGPLRRICQHVAQGYEGQEPGLTCPSAGPGGSGEAEPGRGRGRAGVRLTRGTTLAQRDPGNETRREEGGLVFSLGICFIH